MQIWVLFGAVSVALNLLMALLWIFHSKKKKSKLEELTNALDSMRSNFHAFFNSPTIGVFTGKIGQVAATLNSNLLTMLGIEGTSEFHPFGFLVSQIQEKQLLETGRCGPIEVEVTGKGGHKINLSVTIVSNSGMDGNCIGIVIDVTKLFDVKRQLSKSLERFRALADGSPVGIWNVKRDGQTVYINPAMTALLELESPFELMNSDTRWHDFFTGESLETIEREHGKRNRGQASNYEVEVIGRWGKRRRMWVYGTAVLALDGSVESLMGTFLDITDRKREEEALRQSEERLRVAAECGHDLIYEWSLESGKVDWFGAVEVRLGFSTLEIPRTREAFEVLIHPEDRARVIFSCEKHLVSRDAFLQEYRIRHKDGTYRLWSDRGTAIWDANGVPRRWIGSASDITEARNAEDGLRMREEQLRRSQKLEAVGRLAGGIAHDFNNLLAAIMGYCELMLLKMEPEHLCRREVGEILNGSERAAGLIRQLLAFSLQEIPQPKVINPDFVIQSMERMLRHLLEENIDLKLKSDPTTWNVRIDPVQLEQVVMNLALNARDAMPNGGVLHIETTNMTLQNEIPGGFGRIHPGPHVLISVSDSGTGVDSDHLPYIFDPFYTTKDRGKGNGLGLSTVYGIITQNLGCVSVETEVSKGSVFHIYLPRTEDEADREEEVQKALRSSTVLAKTVLLVEDDSEVRSIVRELLTQQGFLVLEAKHGKDALKVVDNYSLPIHLVLTDMVMPEMGGTELVNALLKLIPGIKVIFMSGYTQDTDFRNEVATGDKAFIQKPFSLGILTGKIRELLS